MLKKIIKKNIDIALKELGVIIEKPFSIEIPKNKKFGDYSTNLALLNARFNKTNPMKLAEEVSEKLKHKRVFKDVSFIKPGFINIVLANYVYHNELINIYLAEDNFAKSDFGQKKKVNIEFVSANPTGPLNIVSARAAAYGDVGSRRRDRQRGHAARPADGEQRVRELDDGDAGRFCPHVRGQGRHDLVKCVL